MGQITFYAFGSSFKTVWGLEGRNQKKDGRKIGLY